MKGFPLRTLSARKKQKKLFRITRQKRASVNPRPHDTGKRAIASVNVGLVALDGVLALLKAPAWTANLIEWTLSFTVVAYHATFAADADARTSRARASPCCSPTPRPSRPGPRGCCPRSAEGPRRGREREVHTSCMYARRSMRHAIVCM